MQQVTIDLEECVVDRVVETRPLGTGQLVRVAPEDGIVQVFDRAGQLVEGSDRRRVFLVCGRDPKQSLCARSPCAGESSRGEFGRLGFEPIENHRGALRSEALRHGRSPINLRESTDASSMREDAER